MIDEPMSIKALPPPRALGNTNCTAGAAPQPLPEAELTGTEGSVMSDECVSDIVAKLQEYVQNVQRNLAFEVDDTTGDIVVRVMDTESKMVIRQIPPEELLAISRALVEMTADEATGLILKTKA